MYFGHIGPQLRIGFVKGVAPQQPADLTVDAESCSDANRNDHCKCPRLLSDIRWLLLNTDSGLAARHAPLSEECKGRSRRRALDNCERLSLPRSRQTAYASASKEEIEAITRNVVAATCVLSSAVVRRAGLHDWHHSLPGCISSVPRYQAYRGTRASHAPSYERQRLQDEGLAGSALAQGTTRRACCDPARAICDNYSHRRRSCFAEGASARRQPRGAHSVQGIRLNRRAITAAMATVTHWHPRHSLEHQSCPAARKPLAPLRRTHTRVARATV